MIERVRTEEMANIIDMLPCMVYRSVYQPPHFPFVFVSDGCTQLFERTADEMTNGFNLTNIVVPDDIEKTLAAYASTLSIGAPCETCFRIKMPDGSLRTIMDRCRISQTDEKGMPHIVEGIMVDITKQLLIDCANSENRESLSFWNKIGKGLREQMTSILGLVELNDGMRRASDLHNNYASIIEDSGHKFIAMVNAMQSFSELERGELLLTPKEYSLIEILDEVVDFAKKRTAKTRLDFAVYLDSKLPATLFGDAARLQEIIIYLLSNAIQFTERGYVSLSVTGQVDNHKADLQIVVEDTGRGIKEEDISILFNPFSQFDNKYREGLGLGLYLANQLAQKMDAAIDVTSSYEFGSIFTLNIAQPVPDTQPLCMVEKPDDIKVLLFHTKKAQRRAIMKSLKSLGVQVLVVADLKAYHDALTTGVYSFIITTSDMQKEYTQTYLGVLTSANIVYADEPMHCVDLANIITGKTINKEKSKTASFTAPGARVLVVDDVDANMTVAAEFLRPYDMQVDTCENGMDAIEAAREAEYDLIFMDYVMPVLNGAETTARIRALNDYYKNVPVVALTADTNITSITKYTQAGFNDCLPKPIDAAQLKYMVAKWIPDNKKVITQEIKAPAKPKPKPKYTIKNVDIEMGIAHTGGSNEIYLRVLKKYYENGQPTIKEMEKCLSGGNADSFWIHAHTLKGLSASIGAAALSRMADELEIAASQGNMTIIQEKTPGFIKEYEELLNNIHPIITQEKKKVLMIDDTEEYLLILNEILMEEYKTIIALDGEDGLDVAKTTKPDIILLDVMMPIMDGYEVLTELKKDPALKDIPVILVTGKTQAADEAKGYEMGAAGYIRKPFQKEVVKEVIASKI